MNPDVMIIDEYKPGGNLVLLVRSYALTQLNDDSNKNMSFDWFEHVKQSIRELDVEIREAKHDYTNPKVLEALDNLASWHI